MSTLTEGTRLVVSGALYSERGHPVFRWGKGDPLTVVLFDGDERTILRRSIWAGRQQNEYWNQFTPISLLGGSVMLFVVAYYLSRLPMLRVAALLALAVGLSPVLPFVPPGVVFVLLYRVLWRNGRMRRAMRDLLMLPTRYFDRSALASRTLLPDGEICSMETAATLAEALRLAPGAKVRAPSPADVSKVRRYSVFGRETDDDGVRRLIRPSDPFAEHLIIPGDPWELARKSRIRARVFELTAVTAFAVGFAGNLILVFVALVAWVR